MLCPPHPLVLVCGPGSAFSRGSVFPGEHTGLSLRGGRASGSCGAHQHQGNAGEGNQGEPRGTQDRTWTPHKEGTEEPTIHSRKEAAPRARLTSSGRRRHTGMRPPDPRAHLLICSSICFTSSDSPPLSPPGPGVALGPPSLGSTAPLSSNERPSKERTRLDRMSRMVSV